MKKLKNLDAIILSKEQQKKIGGARSLAPSHGNHYCTCSDGRVIEMGSVYPPPEVCEIECTCGCT